MTAKTLTEPKPGVWVYDFGQNFSGVEQLRVAGPAGTTVRMRFAEVLNPTARSTPTTCAPPK